MEAHACNPNSKEAETRWSPWIQDQPKLHYEFQDKPRRGD